MSRDDQGEQAARMAVFYTAFVAGNGRKSSGLGIRRERQKEDDGEDDEENSHSPPFCT